MIMVSYNEYLKKILSQILDSYRILGEIQDRPGDLQRINKEMLKTNGFGLPGYWAGHFMMRDKRRAFCLVTDVSKVLALPHADGRVWLLSFEHPQAVLDILRRAAA